MRSFVDRCAAEQATGHAAFLRLRNLWAGLAIVMCLPGCSKAPTAMAPDRQPGRFFGTWVGTITSDVIGTAPAILTIDSQIGPESAPFMSGTWRFAFSNPVFDAGGELSASLHPAGTILGIYFSRTAVPCPGETDGVAQKAIFASMRVDGHQQMHGQYIVGGCPGGTLDLIRK